MLRYFRINDPYRLVGLFVLLVIIYLPLFIDPPGITLPELKALLVGEKLNEGNRMYSGVADSTAPLAAWVHQLLDMLFGRSLLARHILAFFIIFAQSTFLGIVFINKRVFNENTYIPSFLFSILFFFSFDTLALSDELMASGFLLLALNYLFKEIEFRRQQDESILNLGLFISLASLFSFPFIVYLFCVIFILFIFTRISLRKFLLLLFGFLLPHFLVITINYFNDSLDKTWEYYYLANLTFSRHSFMDMNSLLPLVGLPLAYLLISFVMLNREARFSKYQSEILQSIFLWMGFSFLYIFYAKDFRPQNLIVLIPCLSFLFTHFLLLIRRRKYAEMNTWILLVGIVTMTYLARYDKLGRVNYESLLVQPRTENFEPWVKKILVLENDLSLYQKHTPATPFLNWRVSEPVFRDPEYYENVTDVFHALKSDPPDLIIDREDVLRAFFERMPMLRDQYKRQGSYYVRNRISN